MPKVKHTFPKSAPPPPPPIKAPSPRPRKKLMASLYQPLDAIQSSIFRRVCFFNLISKCKKKCCIFKHIELNEAEVQNRLTRIGEHTVFVREYMLMRKYSGLRTMYGIYYVQECLKRELTRVLVEMSIDFTARAKTAEEEELKVLVAEHVMLHLNKVDLSECDDLLLYRLDKQKLLCDFFMETLADTLDFSCFKQIFIKLAQFMVDKGKRFDLKVLKQILERLCISVYEEQLAKTLILMMKNTDEGILETMDRLELERYLLSNGAQELYAEVSGFRVGVFDQSAVADVYKSLLGTGSQEMDISLALSDYEQYTVHNATKLDNLHFNSPSSSDSEEDRPKKKPKFSHRQPQNEH